MHYAKNKKAKLSVDEMESTRMDDYPKEEK